MYYRYGWPLGHIIAKLGITTTILVEVVRDEEAGVFIGTSPDVRGLVVEAETLDGVMAEARDLIPELVCKPSDIGPRAVASIRYRDRIAHA